MASLSRDQGVKKRFQNICSSQSNGKGLDNVQHNIKNHLDVVKQRKIYGIPTELTDANELDP